MDVTTKCEKCGHLMVDHLPHRKEILCPEVIAPLAPDVVRLVVAARGVAFEDQPSREALKELDEASEAFADRVPWEDEPDADTAAA